jgi:hypothetical protein
VLRMPPISRMPNDCLTGGAVPPCASPTLRGDQPVSGRTHPWHFNRMMCRSRGSDNMSYEITRTYPALRLTEPVSLTLSIDIRAASKQDRYQTPLSPDSPLQDIYNTHQLHRQTQAMSTDEHNLDGTAEPHRVPALKTKDRCTRTQTMSLLV